MSGTVASLVVSDGDGARNHGGQTGGRSTRTCMKFDQSVICAVEVRQKKAISPHFNKFVLHRESVTAVIKNGMLYI